MPEGDTVFHVARTLHNALSGRTVRRSDFRVPRLATADLRGQCVLGCAARGKHLLLRTDAGLTLHTHLMMEGAWTLQAPGRRWTGGAAHEIRVVLETDDCTAVGYRLGIVELFETAEEPARLGHLGPDPLGGDWDAAEVLRRLRLRPQRPIGEALLDQTCLAGVGNIFKCETLHLEGVHPLRAVGDVGSLEAVVERAHRLLRFAVRHGRQFYGGRIHDGLYVYGRSGQPCRRCGATVAEQRGAPPDAPSITDADLDRSMRVTYWCPRCQPAGGA